ncbi:MAG: hypothetical protein AAGJ18_05715 [Bacteroidota bacterium]
MEKKYFKCTLLSDIVLNAALATEGNMETLDYIPGSNFLGIVAGALYPTLEAKEQYQDAFDIFHAGKVSFGDAHLSVDQAQSYAMPFAYFKNKLDKEITQPNVYVHHHLVDLPRPTDENGAFIQLKQHRTGFLNPNYQYIPKVEKQFALKSAQDRLTRKSKDEAMFGFESIKKGQSFLFSIHFDQEIRQEIIDKITSTLTEKTRRIGKSKSAQYGQVQITEINRPKTFEDQPSKNDQLVIYAESNLCFLNQFGQSTFKPSVEDFGLSSGTIDWTASQLRTYSYSPWNFKRNTTDTQRNCLQKGSVLVIKDIAEIDLAQLPDKVGVYQAEGLGRVIYNPTFLEANPTGKWAQPLTTVSEENTAVADTEITTPLGQFLVARRKRLQNELSTGLQVQAFVNNAQDFRDVSTSQWGGIRNLAIQSADMEALKIKLFGNNINSKEDNEGFLMNGVAAEKFWDKSKGERRIALLKVMEDNQTLGPTFIAKLASEMAKLKQYQDEIYA